MGTNFPNGISSMGVPVIGGMAMPFTGKHFFIDPVNGLDGNTGKTIQQAFKTPAYCLTQMTEGDNDVAYLIGDGASTGSGRLTTELDWSKDACHLIGIAAPSMVAGRARIAWLSTATKEDTLFTLSADGCIISNIHFFQDYATSAANQAMVVTGNRNYLFNCHIAGGGHATAAAHASCTSLTLTGGGENTFENCTIGLDTIGSGGGANATIAIGTAVARTIFKKCHIVKEAGDTDPVFVVVGAAGITRYIMFEDCLFINTAGSKTMAVAMTVDAAPGGNIFIQGGGLFGAVTNWASGDHAFIQLCGYMNAGSTNLNTGMAHAFDLT